MPFNLLDHPVCLSAPLRTTSSGWTEHVPFGMLLVDLLRPRLLVELGAHTGMSYCAFCQAVDELHLDTRCFAVDTWEGDAQAGFYGTDILADLKQHHDARYASFSTLIQSTFDGAIEAFADHSIDLLHIDGFHTYEAVRHDAETWLPKMSERGVMVFHDVTERQETFGVWKFWDEFKQTYPHHLELPHGHGLGIAAVGDIIPEGLQSLLQLPAPQRSALISLFYDLGVAIEERIAARIEAERRVEVEQQRDELAERVERYEQRLDDATQQLEAERRRAADEHALNTSVYESALAAADQRNAEMQARLDNALWQLSWLEASRGVRLVKLARASRAILRKQGLASLSKRVALWSVGKRGQYMRDVTLNVPVPQVHRQQAREYKQVLFISGCPGDSMRYRCEHRAEQLQLLGCSAEFVVHGSVDLTDMIDRFQCFVLHRVPYGPDIEWLIGRAKELCKPVLFETDDLIFDLDAVKHIAALEDLTQPERESYLDGIRRYRETLLRSDGVTVSTETLRDVVKPLCDTVEVAPNVVSREMVRQADLALRVKSQRVADSRRAAVVIGYFSGSPTHNQDFAIMQDAILWALERYPMTRFKLVGRLQLDARFERFGDRIERVPLQPWKRLPEIYTDVDINVAPLEPNNIFTDSKSSIKYLEAALVGVPTIASPRRDFLRVMRHDSNGLLAETVDEWKSALSQLIESAELRQRLGDAAFRDVRRDSTTLAHAPVEYATMRDLYRSLRQNDSPRKLSVNWVMRAEDIEHPDGRHTALRLAESLGRQGHAVRIFVEPTIQLPDSTDLRDQVRTDHAEVFIGHDTLPAADVSVATDWTTAFTIANHQESLFKCYLAQEFEPERYQPGESAYNNAERAYTLPLQHICIGSSLSDRIARVSGVASQTLAPAVDGETFTMTRPQAERGEPTSVLFFARPGDERHGYESGIEALRQVKERYPALDVRLFGCADDALGALPFEATNLGMLDSEPLANAMNSAHILLALSSTDAAAVALQGMACGMAVVAVDMPSTQEVITTDENGLRVTRQPEAIAAALLKLIEDASLRSTLSIHAANTISAHTYEQSAKQFEQILLQQCW